ncbi:hypothetical protein C8J56DRAFT_1028083 [Mycena floridula]|nr:hypothetical protein C8J56DRAFT_1028083 [Mycena floridula]
MAARTSQIYYVLDNTYDGIKYGGGGSWTLFSDPYYRNGSVLWPAFTVFGSAVTGTAPIVAPGALELAFQGTSATFIGITTIQLYGNTPNTPEFTVSIDGATPYTTSTDDLKPPHYLQWYQSPLLDQGDHIIKLDGLNGTGVDYIVISPGNDTSLTDKLLMVDDSYSLINYANHWEVAPAMGLSGNGSDYAGNVFQNTTHTTAIVGAYLNFSYTGADLTLYGVYDWTKTGSFDLTIQVDQQSPFTLTYDSSAQHTPLVPQQPHFKLFNTGDLSIGDHTVVANLSRCTGDQSLIVDYITYTPGFSSLATMPNLTDGHRTSIPSPDSDNNGSSTKKTPVGAIAGGVVGGVVVLAILAVLGFLFWRKRSRRGEREAEQRDVPPSTAYMVEPFLSHQASSSNFTPVRRISASDRPQLSERAQSSIASFSATSAVPTTALQPEIRQRMMELERLIEQSESQSGTGDLRRQIEALTEENERLASIASPPAYGSSDDSGSLHVEAPPAVRREKQPRGEVEP